MLTMTFLCKGSRILFQTTNLLYRFLLVPLLELWGLFNGLCGSVLFSRRAETLSCPGQRPSTQVGMAMLPALP